jgi:4-oxalocrotonate tautomerase
MPIIEVKAFDRRFDADEAKAAQLIEQLTEAMASVYGDEIRDETWVILEGVKPSRWGFGGKLRQ